MADFVALEDGHRVTRRDDTAPHQIVILRKRVGCMCRTKTAPTVDGAQDHWLVFNQLAHDLARGPFVPVDVITGALPKLAGTS